MSSELYYITLLLKSIISFLLALKEGYLISPQFSPLFWAQFESLWKVFNQNICIYKTKCKQLTQLLRTDYPVYYIILTLALAL